MGYHQKNWYIHIGVPKGKRESIRNLTQRNNGKWLPKSGEGNTHPDPWSPKDTKKEKSKEIHSLTYCKQPVKSLLRRENFESTNSKAICHLQGSPIRLWVDFSAETVLSRREWDNVFNVLQVGGTCQLRILYLSKVSFKNKEDKDFCRKKLSEFVTTRTALQELLMGVLQVEKRSW